jgi:hypothetical protein
VCVTWSEVAVCLFVGAGVSDECGFVTERGQEVIFFSGVVVAEYGCDGVGECEGGDLVEHGGSVSLGSDEASEGERGVAA